MKAFRELVTNNIYCKECMKDRYIGDDYEILEGKDLEGVLCDFCEEEVDSNE